MNTKRILHLFSFIILIIIFDYVIGSALEYSYFNETSGLHYRTTYSIDSTNAEVLVFGASRANHSYVPNILEDSLDMSFYNTGRDGTDILYNLAILKSVLKRYSPKLIILDFYEPFADNPSSYERLSVLAPYCRDNEEIRDIVNLKGPYEKYKMYSRIYPYNSQFLTIAIGNMEMNKARKKDMKGYVALYGKWNKPIDTIAIKEPKIDSIKIIAFKEFINLAKENNIDLVVVYSPIYAYYAGELIENQLCHQICLDEGIEFIDYSNDTSFINNREYFHDLGHLNNDGAIIFTNNLINQLKSKAITGKSLDN